jgi:hypothetical protein
MGKVDSSIFVELLPKNEVESLKVIEMKKTQNLKIEKFYLHLSKSNFPYDALCWALAELEIIFEKGSKNYSESDVIRRAEKIFDSDLNYDPLCWIIARFKIYLEEIGAYP